MFGTCTSLVNGTAHIILQTVGGKDPVHMGKCHRGQKSEGEKDLELF